MGNHVSLVAAVAPVRLVELADSDSNAGSEIVE
jgi:hypothetical protein